LVRERCRGAAESLCLTPTLHGQGMVQRTDYNAVIAESKALKEKIEAKEGDIASLEQQLARVKENLKGAMVAMDEKVSKTELHAAKLRCEQLEAQAARTGAEHAKALDEVNDRLRESLLANDKLMKTMQARLPCRVATQWLHYSPAIQIDPE
jgi:chromosome segregation ATPase